MTTRTIENNMDRDDAIRLIKSMNLPMTINIKKGKDRSVEQNRLQRLWINEAVEQLQDERAEDKRAHCKLYYGVPILRNENDEFKEVYDRIIRPHTIPEKLEMMKVPLDFPVTRLMNSGQCKRYLDDIRDHFLDQGVVLTEPDE